MSLTDKQQMLLMAYADGELSDPEELKEAKALLEATPTAQGSLDAFQTAAVALRGHVEGLADGVDVSMVRGRVMTRLPAPSRPAVAESVGSSSSSMWSWLSPRWLIGGGLVTAAALFALMSNQPTETKIDNKPLSESSAPVVAKMLPDEATPEEPSVIIEEIDIDGGTVLVEGAEEPGEAMVIWHIEAEGEAG